MERPRSLEQGWKDRREAGGCRLVFSRKGEVGAEGGTWTELRAWICAAPSLGTLMKSSP